MSNKIRSRKLLNLETLEDRLNPSALLEKFALEESPKVAVLSPAPTRSLVFLDESLSGQIPQAELSGSKVVLIDPSRDVFGQVDKALAGASGIQTLRLISHGKDGALVLGNQIIDESALNTHKIEVAGWGKSLVPGADILVYGCSVATTQTGQHFVDTLSRMTGADVAASSNPTGAGGDLVLEYKTGKIQDAPLATQAQWNKTGLQLILQGQRVGSWTVNNGSGQQWTNNGAFAVLKKDGSVASWGGAGYGGTGAPTGTGFVQLFTNYEAFSGLKSDGSIVSWGLPSSGGTGAPTGTGFTQIFSTARAFAALKSDGSIKSWGDTGTGGTGAPTGTGFTQIFSNQYAFSALKSDGSIVVWGSSTQGGSGAPTGSGFVRINSTNQSFVALKSNGSVASWGNSSDLGAGAPTGTNFTQIFTSIGAFAALRSDGSIAAWGNSSYGGTGAPTGTGFTNIFSSQRAFVALKSDGSMVAWGNSGFGGTGAPTGTGFTQIASSGAALATLKPDGTIIAWGDASNGGNSAPTGTGFKKIYSNYTSFAALRSDGSVVSWGNSGSGGTGAPTGTGFTQIFVANGSYAAMKSDGSLVSWGNGSQGGSGAPSGNNFLTIQTALIAKPYFAPGKVINYSIQNNQPFSQNLSAIGFDITYSVTSGSLPAGLSLDSTTGVLSGTPTNGGNSSFTITASNTEGATPQAFSINVQGITNTTQALLPNQRAGAGGSHSNLNGSGQQITNSKAFAALNIDSSISAWGDASSGGTGAPTGTGFTQIFSSSSAFAALKTDGSIAVWGNSGYGGAGAPTGTGFTQIYSTTQGFAALKTDGSVSSWGAGTAAVGAPTGTGYTQIYSNQQAFAALKNDGTIAVWGNTSYGGSSGPSGNGFSQIFNTSKAFAALKSDGSIVAWGDASSGGTGAPTGTGFVRIFSTLSSFAALKVDGSIIAWGNSSNGGTGAPTANGFTQIFSTVGSFAGLKSDGSITVWGSSSYGGTGAPTGAGFLNISSTLGAFAALKSDGSIVAWGTSSYGSTGAPSGAGFTQIYSNNNAFAALKSDGSLSTWGSATSGGTGAPTRTGYIQIYKTDTAFAALNQDGSISTWGGSTTGGTGAPTGNNVLTVQTVQITKPYFAPGQSTSYPAQFNQAFSRNIGGIGFGLSFAIESGNLPAGLTLNSSTGVISGTPTALGSFTFNISATNSQGKTSQSFTIGVGLTSTTVVASASPAIYGNSVTFTATVTPVVGSSPTGTVTFLDGNTTLGTGTLNGSGVATFSTSALIAGTHSIVASYGGGSSFYTSTSSTLSEVVNAKDLTITAANLTKASGVAVGSLATGFTTVGLVSGDSVTGVTYSSQGYAAIASVGNYAIVPSNAQGTGLANYNITYVTGNLTVTGLLPSQRIGSWTINNGSGQQFSNQGAFAAIKTDGSIAVWGDSTRGGTGAPTGTGFVQITSNYDGFAALKNDGSIKSWGLGASGGTGAPTGTGFTQIFSTTRAFAALKSDGSIKTWGDSATGGTGAPTGTGFTQIFSNQYAFSALKSDGSIVAWGSSTQGGSGAPTGTGFVRIISTNQTFAALKSDGSVVSWGNSTYLGAGAPTGTGFTQLFSTIGSFAALKSDGSITVWGNSSYGATGAPTGTGFTTIFSSQGAFAALKGDGSITTWGTAGQGGTGAPTGTGFTQIYSSGGAFAALKSDGSIRVWGDATNGGTGAPTGTGFKKIYSNYTSFAALKTDGSVVSWGNSSTGGTGAPTGTGFTQIFLSNGAYAALKNDGSIVAWGNSSQGGTGAPSGNGYLTIQSNLVSLPYFAPNQASDFSLISYKPYSLNLVSVGLETFYSVDSGSLPDGLTLNPVTGVVSGTPTTIGFYSFSISASNSEGSVQKSFTLSVDFADTATTLVTTASPAVYGNTVTFTATVSSTTGYFASGTVTFKDGGTTLGTASLNSSGVATLAIGSLAVGSHTITASYGGDLSFNNSDSSSITETIQVRSLVITPRSFTKIPGIGITDQSTGFTTSGLFNGDSISGVTLASSGYASSATLGSYPIVASNAQGTGLGNYSISYGSGTVTVSGLLPGQRDRVFTGNIGSGQAYPSNAQFVGTKPDGSLLSWHFGSQFNTNTPTGNGFNQIVSSFNNFAALKSDGTIVAWGDDATNGELSVPTGNQFTQITASVWAFAALRRDGSIASWGTPVGNNVPTGTGYVKIYSNLRSFAALKADGSISVWGEAGRGGDNGPTGTGFVQVFTAGFSYTALKADGSVVSWGRVSPAPTGTGIVQVFGGNNAFVGLKSDGSIVSWGEPAYGGTGAPTGTGFVNIYNNYGAFTAVKPDGSLTTWGNLTGGPGAPTGTGFTQITNSNGAFAALKPDGSIGAWGYVGQGGTGAPTGTGYTKIIGTLGSFAALKSDGSVSVWGDYRVGGGGGPSGTGWTEIYSNSNGFAATKPDGTIYSWSDNYGGNLGLTLSAGGPLLAVQTNTIAKPYFSPGGTSTFNAQPNQAFSQNFGAVGMDLVYSVASGSLPNGLTLNANTGVISGTPTTQGTSNFTLAATNSLGSAQQAFSLKVSLATTTSLVASANPATYGSSVTYTATVNASSGTPTGSVTFKDGLVTLGTGTLNGAGIATFSISTLTAGSHSITASYGGDGSYSSSTSSTVSQTIQTKALTITAKDGSKVMGNTITPAGTEFTSSGLVNGDTVNTVTLTSPGFVSTAAVGTYAITPSAATGTGLSNYSITYVNGTQTVTAVLPIVNTINLSSSSINEGASATVSGTFSYAAGSSNAGSLPAGLFHLYTGDGNANDSIGTSNGTLGSTTKFATGLQGQAFSFDGAQSSVASFPVNISPSSYPQLTMGMWVNMQGVAPGNGWIMGQDNGGYDRSLITNDPRYGYGLATGIGGTYSSTLPQPRNNLNSWHFIAVAFDQNARQATVVWDNQSQTISVNNNDGNSMFTLGGLANFGSHTANALVDNVFLFNRRLSTSELEQVRTNLVGSPTSYTGTATWNDGVTTPLTISNNTFTTTRNFPDDHPSTSPNSNQFIATVSITADNKVTGSASSSPVTVSNVAPNTVSINTTTTSLNTDGTTTVSGSFSDPGVQDTHTVVINWGDGTTNSTVNLGAGVTTFSGITHQFPANGSYTVTATVTDKDSGVGSATQAVTVAVTNPPSKVSVGSSANLTTLGSSLTFTATVTSGFGPGTPTGTVTFLDGTTTLGTATLNGSGVATITTSNLSNGSGLHSVTASYGGDSSFKISTSPVFLESVIPNPLTGLLPGQRAGVFSGNIGSGQAYPSNSQFVGTKPDGSLLSWHFGSQFNTNTPTGTGFNQIVSSFNNFAALKSDGTIVAWGDDATNGQLSVPTGNQFTQITASVWAFAALRSDGSIASWGTSVGNNVPTGTGYVKIYSNLRSFAALKADGSISVWGEAGNGGDNGPTGTGFVQVITTGLSYTALKADGSVVSWGRVNSAPTGTGIVQVFGQGNAFAGLKSDGSIVTWGEGAYGGTGATGIPTGTGYVSIYTNFGAFTAVKPDGSLTTWGNLTGGPGAPTGTGFTQITNSNNAFAALKPDGSIAAWGYVGQGGTGAPTGTGYTKIIGTLGSFAALKADGSVSVWGDYRVGGGGGPSGTGWTEIYSNSAGFAATKPDGTIYSWSDNFAGNLGVTLSAGGPLVSVQRVTIDKPYFPPAQSTVFYPLLNTAFSQKLGAVGLETTYSVTSGSLPAGLSLDPLTGVVSGLATSLGSASFTIAASNSLGTAQQAFSMVVTDGNTTTALVASATPSVYGSAVTFTATVTPDVGVATGSVTFKDGSTTLGTSTLNGSGIATFTTTSLSAGSHSITATYNTGGNFKASTSSALSETISQKNLVVTASDRIKITGIAIGSTGTGFAATGLVNGDSITSVTYTSNGYPANAPSGSYAIVPSNAQGTGLSNYNISYGNGTLTATGLLPGQRAGVFSINSGSGQAYPSNAQFVGTKPDGSLLSWHFGSQFNTNTPTGTGFNQIVSSFHNFAALKSDGSIVAWGDDSTNGQLSVPTGNQFTQLSATIAAFAALRTDGSIASWGSWVGVGNSVPTGTGYVQIIANVNAFAALKADGSISVWGLPGRGGDNGPTGTGFVQIVNSRNSFAAIKADGSVVSWGPSGSAPTGTGITQLFGGLDSFAGLKPDGSIVTWGESAYGGTGAPTGTGYTSIYGNFGAFTAVKPDGSLTTWGNLTGGPGAPTGTGFTQITNSAGAFAALKPDSSIAAWGYVNQGGTGAPTGTGYTKIIGSGGSFAALKADGSVSVWGDYRVGGGGGPSGTGWTQIYPNSGGFAATKPDGTIYSWSDNFAGNLGLTLSAGGPLVAVQTITIDKPYFPPAQSTVFYPLLNTAFSQKLGAIGLDTSYSVTSGSLPAGLSLDPLTGVVSGLATSLGSASFTIAASNSLGTAQQAFSMVVTDGNTTTALVASATPSVYGSAVTFTATVTPDVSIATGSVTFKDGSTTLGTSLLNGSGIATFTTTSLSAGIHSITANYNTGGNFKPSTSSALSETISQKNLVVTASDRIKITGIAIGSTGTGFAATGLVNGDSITSVTYTSNGYPANAPSGSYAIVPSNAQGTGLSNYNISYGNGTLTATGLLPGQRAGVFSINSGSGQAYPSNAQFVGTKPDGSLLSWHFGSQFNTNTPTGTGFNQIVSSFHNFAALKSDGSIVAWGDDSTNGQLSVPTGNQFTQLSATIAAFAALRTDGSIASWGSWVGVGNSVPTGTGYVQIIANVNAFAALKADGSISVWGLPGRGGDNGPTGTGFVQIVNSRNSFAAIKADGSVVSWGPSGSAPTETGITQLFGGLDSFAGLKPDGSIVTWGEAAYGGTGAPTGTGYTSIYGNFGAFTAVKPDGSLTTWGNLTGGPGAPTGTGFTQITNSAGAFAALKPDSSIAAWGYVGQGGTGAPTGTGYTKIIGSGGSFAALKADGSVSVWGDYRVGGGGGPSGTGWTQIYPNSGGFAATKPDGTIYSWSDNFAGNLGLTLSAGGPLVAVQTITIAKPYILPATSSTFQAQPNQAIFLNTGISGLGMAYAITSGSLPSGVTLDSTRGVISGTPTSIGNFPFEVTATNSEGSVKRTFSLTISSPATTTTLTASASSSVYGDGLTFTATVSAAAGIPTGTITFKDGSTTLGTGTLNGSGIATIAINRLAAGTHSIIATYGGDPNYQTSTSTAVSETVAKKSLTVTGTTASNKVYDGTTQATLSTGGSALSGILNWDASQVNLVTSGVSGSFGDPKAGTAKSVSVAGFTLSGTAISNYILVQPTVTANISTKAITGSFYALDRDYDGTTIAGVYLALLDGVLEADYTSLIITQANFESKNVGVTKTVHATTYYLDGVDATNYNLVSIADSTASVMTKSVLVDASSAGKVYDGTTSASVTLSSDDKAVGDNLNFAYQTAVYDSAKAGSRNIAVKGITISGSDSANYSLANTETTTTATISQKGISGSFTAANKTYSGTTGASVSGTSVVGAISGDAVTLAISAASFDTRNVGTGKTVTANTYGLIGADAANYTLTSVATTTADITKLGITGSFTAGSKTYDGKTSASASLPVLAGTVAGDSVNLVLAGATFADKNVGTAKTVTATSPTLSGADAGNYSLTSVSTATADITKLGITGSFSSANKTYDGNTVAAETLPVLSGTISGDSVDLVLSGATFADKNVGKGKTVTATSPGLSGTDAGNYDLTGVATTTADITRLAISGSFTAVNKTYDGKTLATVNGTTLAGTVSGDVVTLGVTSATFADKNVGTAKTVTANTFGLSGTDAGNYNLTGVSTTTADITRLGITGSFSSANKTYDGNTTAAASLPVLAGTVSGDTVNLVLAGATFADKNVGTAKTVTATNPTLSGTDAGNYNLTGVATTTADITKLGISGSFTAGNKTYDGSTTAAATLPVLAGAVSGDTVSLVLAGATFADKNVGTAKTVTATSPSLSGTDASNYNLTGVATTTADITKLGINGSFTAGNKTYDGNTTATVTGTSLAGTVSGDTVSLGVTNATFADKNVATAKTVTANTFGLNGTDAGNYNLTGVSTASADITKLGITGSFSSANKVYDGNTSAAATLPVLAGTVSGDSVNLVLAGATFADKNVGTAKTVTATSPTLSGTDAGNYNLTGVSTTTADITKLGISGSFNAGNKTYDGKTTAATSLPVLTGTVSGDSVNLVLAGATFADKNVGTAKTVTATSPTLSGNDAGNYDLTGVATTTADITKLGITGSFSSATKTYDGNTTAAASLPILAGTVSGDTVNLVLAGATFADKNVGTAKTVTATSPSLTGADAGNYNLTEVATTTADITRLGISGSFTAGNKTYDGNTTAAATLPVLAGTVSGDSVNLVLAGATFTDKNVGTAKTVTATSPTLSGTDAGNYNLTGVSTTTADITKLGISGSFTAGNKTYDGNTTATVTGTSLAGTVSGDTVSLGVTNATFADKNVATAKTVTANTFGLSGTDAGNYNLTGVSTASADITKLGITGSFSSANKIYDGNTSAAATLPVLTGTVSGDSVNLVLAGATFADKNVGTSKTVTATSPTLSGTDADNYNLTGVSTTTADITKLGISGFFNAGNKTYDGNTTATVTGTGLAGTISGDVVSLGVTNATFADKNVGTAKTVTANTFALAGADAGNYNLTGVSATTADITKLGISGTFTAANKVYNGTTDAIVSGTGLPGMISGDVVSLDVTKAIFSDKNVGTAKTVTAQTYGLSGTDAANYNLTGVATTTADITKLGIKGSFTAANKVYDATTPATVTGTALSGTISGDDVALNVVDALFADSDAGGWSVNGTYSLIGTTAGNYNLDTVFPTVATITQAPQIISWADPSAITYGTALSSTQLNATVTGITGGTSPGTLSYTPGLGEFLNAGTQSLTVTAAATENYLEATKTVNILVNKAALALTFNNQTKVYGDANPGLTYTLTGAVNGDTFTVTPSTTADLNSPVGSYGITGTISGTQVANYTTTINDGSLVITARSGTAVYTGPSFISTSTASIRTNLTAQVSSTGGSLTNATVNFYDALSNALIATGTVDANGVATASNVLLSTISGGNAGGYLIRAQLAGSYENTNQVFPTGTWTSANLSAYGLTTVLSTVSGYVQGAGTYAPSGATGTLSSSTYGNNSFGISAKAGVSTGWINLVIPKADGIYILRANAISSVTSSGSVTTVSTTNATLYKVATVSGGNATSYTQVATGITINAQLDMAGKVSFNVFKGSTSYWNDNTLISLITGQNRTNP